MAIRRFSFFPLAAALTVIISVLAAVPVYSADTPERISIAYSKDSVPFHFTDTGGQPAGSIIDLWRLWSEKTGIKIDFQAADWDETLSLVGSGITDVHAGLFFNQERDKFLDFGGSLTLTDTHVFTHNALPPVNEISDLAPYRVGVLAGDFVEGYLNDRLPKGTLLPVEDYTALMNMLQDGTLRVFAADTPTALFHLEKSGLLAKFSYISEKPLYQNHFFFAVKKGNRVLIEQINQGMALITDEERRDINRKWVAATDDKDEALIISIDRAYAPLTFTNAFGKPSGLFVDMWRAWSKETGLQIQFRATGWRETLDGLKFGDADIHSGLSYTKKRDKWIDFSSQVYETYTRVYHRIDDYLPADIEAYDSRAIGVWDNTYQEAKLREEYPSANVRDYGSNQELIDALLKGEIDAFLQEEQLMEAELDRLGLRAEIAVRQERLFPSTVHAGVLKGNSELLEQINNGFAAIPRESLAELERRWIPNPENHFYKPDTKSTTLSVDEEAWLNAHPVTNIAVTTFIAPIDIVDDEGSYTGFNADLIGLLNKRLGTTIVPVFFNKWPDVVKSATSGKVDGALSFSRTPERDKHMLYTQPYAYDPIVTVIRKEDKRITQKEDIAGKRVSALKGLAFIELIRSAVGDTGEVLEFDNEIDALKALVAGEVDAHISTLIMYGNTQKKEFVPNLRIAVSQNLEGGSLRIAIHKSKPHLFSIIQKGLNSISRTELSELRERWLSPTPRQKAESHISLNEEERDWLASNREIRLGIDPSWAPFEFIDKDGKYSGVSSGYIEAAANRLNIKMRPVQGLSWSQVIEAVKTGAIDVLPAVMRTSDREQYLNFSKPYESFPIIIAAHTDLPYFNDLNDLAGYKVGVVKDYYTAEVLARDYLNLTLTRFATLDQGLQALDAGKLDAFVDSLGAITYEISQSRLMNIKITAPTAYKFELAFGVRKDWPELVGILNKVIDDIGDKEKRFIKNTWMTQVKVQYGINLKKIMMWAVPIGASVVLIIIFVFVWNRRLSREVTERKRAEKELRISESKYMELVEDANSIILKIDQTGVITFFNEYAQKFFGFTAEEIIGRNIGGTLIPEVDSSGADMRRFIEEVALYPERYEQNENENIRKDGSRVWVSWSNRAIFDEESGEVTGILSVGNDITEQKALQEERDEAFQVITSSIEYATNIQGSILPSSDSMEAVFGGYFALWEPRDRVGGDIYFLKPWGLGKMFALGDCTGHGVPGAFMTLIANGALEMVLLETPPGEAGMLLQRTHQLIQEALGQEKEEGRSNDGLEMGVCYLAPRNRKMVFAGARFSLFCVQNGEVSEIKGDKKGLGYRGIPHNVTFINHDVPVDGARTYYMTTDGFIDQIGGQKRRSFGKRRFKSLLLELEGVPMDQRRDRLFQALVEYQGDEKRRDDLAVAGFTIT